jgi:hypothetical protein
MTANQIQKAKDKLNKQTKNEVFKRVMKYLYLVSDIPLMADDLEELNDTIFIPELAPTLRKAVRLLREQDELFLNGAEKEVIDQQCAIQLEILSNRKSMFLNELKN